MKSEKPFSKRFEILGAIVTLPSPGGTTIEVTNKESRLLQLKQQVDLYAAGHTYGRTTQLACQLLHKFGGQGPSVTVTPELVHVVSEALSFADGSQTKTGSVLVRMPASIVVHGWCGRRLLAISHSWRCTCGPLETEEFFHGRSHTR